MTETADQALLDELNHTHPYYRGIVLGACVASNVVYNERPNEKLNEYYNNYNHGIKSLCESKTMHDYKQKFPHLLSNKQELENFEIYSKYIICSQEICGEKRLIVSFRGTHTWNDFFTDAQAYGALSTQSIGSFHYGFFSRAETIPIEYFLDILNTDDSFSLVVFTGHSLGAAIAAIVTIRVLLDARLKNLENASKRVLFIGFGCPLFADKAFREYIQDMNLHHRFHFYKNVDDIIVDLLDILSAIFYTQDRPPDIQNSITSIKSNLLDLLKSMLPTDTTTKLLVSFCEEIVGFCVNAIFPNYQQFGIFFQINNNGDINKYTEYDEIKEISNNNLNRIFNEYSQNRKDLFKRVQNHYMINYFRSLKMSSQEGVIHNVSITMAFDYIGLKIPDPSDWKRKENVEGVIKRSGERASYAVEVYKNQKDSDIYFYFSTHNLEYIYYVFLETKRENIQVSQYILPKIIRKPLRNHYLFVFNHSNTFLEDLSNVTFTFRIFSYFNMIELNLKSNDIKLIEIAPTSKEKNIFEMPLHMLYLHAASYIKLYQQHELKVATDNVNFKSNELELFARNSDRLKRIFDKLWQPRSNILLDSSKRDLFISTGFEFEVDVQDDNMSLNEKIASSNTNDLYKRILVNIYELVNLQVNAEYEGKSLSQYIIRMINRLLYKLKSYFSDRIIENDGQYRDLVKYLYEEYSDPRERNTSKLILEEHESYIYRNCEQLKAYNDKMKNSIEMIALNYEIRQILLEGTLIGVVGTKKSGKSSFIELITGKKTGASALTETKTFFPYEIEKNSIILIDYPHYNSTEQAYKLQFVLTRHLLNYVFFIHDSMQLGDTLTTDFTAILDLLSMMERNNDAKFHFVFSKIDVICCNEGENNLYDFIRSRYLLNRFGPYIDRIIWTSLKKSAIDMLKNELSMEEANQNQRRVLKILIGEEFKKELLSVIHKFQQK